MSLIVLLLIAILFVAILLPTFKMSFGSIIAKFITLDSENTHKIYELFCNEIRKSLKSPSSAVFCKENELFIKEHNGMYYVSGWVDSQNSYGAMIRTNIKDFKIKNENGLLIPKSNANIMASNSLLGKLATNWVLALIWTIITMAIIYFIMSNTIL